MNELLIFLLVHDSKWDLYAIQPARVIDSGDFYNYEGSFVGIEPSTVEEKEVLEMCRRLEVSYLYKTYGSKKYKTEREFIENSYDELIKVIRPFTDKVIDGIIKKIAAYNLPLYLKKSHLDNPYKRDRLEIVTEALNVSLGFYRNEENIRYQLTLNSREKKIVPSLSHLHIITFKPGILLLDKQLYYLPEGVSGIRIKPFFTKKEIIIPRQNEKEYFKKFILKNIYNEDIEAEGFEVLERDCQPTPILSLEKDIAGNPLIELLFRYNNHIASFSNKLSSIVELEEDGENYRFYKTARKRKWEKSCSEFLLQKGLKILRSDYYNIPENDSWYTIMHWLTEHKSELKKKGFEISQKNLSVQYYIGNWELDYSEEISTDWFQLHANIILDDGNVIPLQALWQNILSGKREYYFGENYVFIIPEEWFARYSAIMLFGKKDKNQLFLQRNQFSLLEKEKQQSVQNEGEPVKIPAKLKATLRSYQLTGYQWLYNLYKQGMGACLADDMGLGKTIQTISLLLKYKEETIKKTENYSNSLPIQGDLFSGLSESEPKKESDLHSYFSTCLIVAPASVVHNWRNELRKFAPSFTVLEYTGGTRINMRISLMRWEIVITTYQTLRNDIGFLKELKFGIVVFDESQSFKNRDSQVYQAVSQIRGEHYIALSGTPIENSLSDLWSLMSVINKGLLGDHATFYKYFIRPITSDVNGMHSDSLRKLTQPFILRRTKEEVLKDLPDRTDELIICETDPEQQKLYDEELSKARNRILERKLLQKTTGEALGSLQAIIRLRQIANHPRMANPDYKESSGKFREIFRMLEELIYTHHKVLLFSDYVSFLNLIAEEMNGRNWKYTMLTGSTTNREEVIKMFSVQPDCQFFLISLKAGGVGLNLTEADYVFILDPWWNLAAEEQAISRSHRMGQKQAVFVYRFITSGTLEEKILHIQQQKQSLSDAIISPTETTFQPTEKELEKLLME